MNRDDIIRMAREAGISKPWDQEPVKWETLERFANLVAAAERERIKWDTIHSCHPECDKPVCVAIRKAVAAEREACAALCERLIGSGENKDSWTITRDLAFYECAAAIRARGDALAKLNQAAEDNGEEL